jgi:hypothetical protein
VEHATDGREQNVGDPKQIFEQWTPAVVTGIQLSVVDKRIEEVTAHVSD